MSEISLIERAEKTLQEFKDHNVKIRYPKLFEEYNALLKTQKEVDAIYSTIPIQYQDFAPSNVILLTTPNLSGMHDIGSVQYYDAEYLQKECTRRINEIANMEQDIEYKISRIESYTKDSAFESPSVSSGFPLGTELDPLKTTLSRDDALITGLKNQIDDLEKQLSEERKKSNHPRLTSKSDRLTAKQSSANI